MTATRHHWRRADEFVPVWLSRSGYTGEDGFEISLPGAEAEAFARLLLARAEVAPAGLAARDSLRLEAGLCLYGQDMGLQTGPAEAGLLWTIPKARRAQGGFAGAKGMAARGKPSHRRTGFMLESPRPARAGWKIHLPQPDNPAIAGEEVGHLTSAAVAPTSPFPLAMGYLSDRAEGKGRFFLKQGERALHARRHALPFRKHQYYRGPDQRPGLSTD